jgi:hypothetical protein
MKNKLNESSDKQGLPNFFKRRVDHHKFEKMLKQGVRYIYYESESLNEFKWKLVEATLENYIFYKYNINIDEQPKEDVDRFIKYMIDVYDPLLFRYYHTMKNNKGLF